MPNQEEAVDKVLTARKKIDWRKEPTDFEMVNEDSALVPATDSRGKDRAYLASLLDCEFTEIRSMTTVYMAWDAEEAERQWRADLCECPPEIDCDGTDCKTVPPARDVWDFWDESGTYCPWAAVEKDNRYAVAFRLGEL